MIKPRFMVRGNIGDKCLKTNRQFWILDNVTPMISGGGAKEGGVIVFEVVCNLMFLLDLWRTVGVVTYGVVDVMLRKSMVVLVLGWGEMVYLFMVIGYKWFWNCCILVIVVRNDGSGNVNRVWNVMGGKIWWVGDGFIMAFLWCELITKRGNLFMECDISPFEQES